MTVCKVPLSTKAVVVLVNWASKLHSLQQHERSFFVEAASKMNPAITYAVTMSIIFLGL